MSTQIFNLKPRITALHSVLTTEKQKEAVEDALKANNGDWAAALPTLKSNLTSPAFKKVSLAHSLAEWSDNNVPIVSTLAKKQNIKNLRDVALRLNTEQLAEIVDPNEIPANISGETEEEKQNNFAASLQHKLFAVEPSAILLRMAKDKELPIADETVRKGVASFLTNQPDFNIRTTALATALQNSEAFKNIPEEQQPEVVNQLKILQRVQAISPIPEVIPTLMQANLTSAFLVSEMPESAFMHAYGKSLGEAAAAQVYTNAINARIRNEQALMSMRESIRGTGLAIMDGSASLEQRMASMQKTTDQKAVPLNLENLFGDMDYCACEECQSVYSPAAYFVELLQYLRNNNLDPDNPNTGQEGIANTPVEKLFRRRPDLGCLELTCENTFTVLPYIDLVNEVMESFVVHLDDYAADTSDPKQATLEVFNIEDEITSELLAQPQHINYQAYCILKHAVYPFTLPYHQPIDEIRIFLTYLETSRYELQDTYRTALDDCDHLSLPAHEEEELQSLHTQTLDRAVDAEFLGLTQEEYIILTKEAFWPKRYFDITQNTTHTEAEYRQNIGVKPVHEYYGYDAEEDMLSIDEAQMLGLTFVKKEFLTRTGIQYTDLVELLKTQFINPNFPQGRALTTLESIRFSYRFLQKLVDTSSTNPSVRFAKLVAFLETVQPVLPLLNAFLHPDPCQEQKMDWCLKPSDFRNWVYCYFERIGKLIVLEAGEGPRLSVFGELYTDGNPPEHFGTLHHDGTITDPDGQIIIGSVLPTGQVIGIDGNPLLNDDQILQIRTSTDVDFDVNGYIQQNFIVASDISPLVLTNVTTPIPTPSPHALWFPAQDTCDLDKVRLVHLDGTVLTAEEYDRIHRFIRLWHKLGWTIDETDKALIGLSTESMVNGGRDPSQPDTCEVVGFEQFEDDCQKTFNGSDDNCDDDPDPSDEEDCPDLKTHTAEITPHFLHQLVAVKKLLDQTGLALPKLLTFWTLISTVGEKSLYSRLFLTHNLLSIDEVFKADRHGNFLTTTAKITDHLTVLMAALRLKADDITLMINFLALPDSLTIRTVSTLYRYSLLAKVLKLRVSELPSVIALFGNPFVNAHAAHRLFKIWGKMEDAGFTFPQLNYLIQNHDDVLRPIAPNQKAILQLTKTLYDGLNQIDVDHADVSEDQPEEETADLIRAKAGLLFEQSVVEEILGVLEGTHVYTTNAPANLTLTIPEELASKLQYNNQADTTPPQATLQVTGILTEAEKTEAKSFASQSGWAEALNRVEKQAHNFFNDVLFGIFTDQDSAKAVLLAPDINVPFDPENPDGTDNNTAPLKRLYFLEHFLPFLRQRLAHRFIVETLAGTAGLDNEVTDLLLADILVAGSSGTSALKALEAIQDKPSDDTNGWQGYFIPSVADTYTFIAIGDTQPPALFMDGQSIPFPHQQEDPSNVWSSDPVKLKSGKLYHLTVTDRSAEQLEWKTATSPPSLIPVSMLLPDYSAQGTAEILITITKAAIVINGFDLSADEVNYWQNHSEDFDDFDLNQVTLQHWLRLHAYTTLRNSLVEKDTILLDLFRWSRNPEDPSDLSEKIVEVTGWHQENIEKLIAPHHFNLDHPEAFHNEVNLVKLQKALKVADKIGVEINWLFDWAKPTSKFWVTHQIAEDIRKAIRARFDQEDWEQVVKPLNDQLREHQKQALISYLLIQPDLIEWGVVDADSLFEFFLIDVQMDACMETSRIKQGISSIQLFIQRCLLGLEERYGVPNGVLDRDRWAWMQRYRVWEANRKVFLYPENWLRAELRDDKSPFYLELESELLQKDINPQTVQDAMKSYLFKVDEVANLKVVGLFQEQEPNSEGELISTKLHVFSRTRNAPYFFYYRYFEKGNWYAWEKVQVDIPNYELENDTGELVKKGTYLIPVVWNKRLLVFFPQLLKKTKVPQPGGNITIEDSGGNLIVPINPPLEFWEIKMGWTEYRNGKWTQKQVSDDAVYHDPIPSPLPDVSLYEFIPRVLSEPNPTILIDIHLDDAIGAFQFNGSQISVSSETVIETTVETDFHYTLGTTEIHSLQAVDSENPPALFSTEPYFNTSPTSVTVNISGPNQPFFHPFVHEVLNQITSQNLDEAFEYYLNDVSDLADAYGADPTATYHELKRSYSLYNWEAAFHAPMLLVDQLLNAQQFEQALKVCHYIFDPMAEGTGTERFWQFAPFREVNAENVLERLFQSLTPNQPDDRINEWRDKPFQPHVVARSRPSGYMKWVVMKYIEILIAWGDYLFQQDTIETLNQATQLYILAAHIYGPRGYEIPKRGEIQPQTYNSLLDKWDAFSNAMVELELAFPFSNQTPFPIGFSNGVVGLANVFGFATSLYFCIPDNPKLRGLRETIDDRLFKIRNCQNIEGVFRKLPLFEPPIDPALLVQAAAQGLSLASVLNDLNAPAPNYRFYYLLQKALELCSELKSMGNTFLSVKEKADAEALSQLRASHETSIHDLVMEMKKLQLEEAEKSLESLQQSRLSPVYRLQHYLQLIGEDLSLVPDSSTDFNELNNQLEAPVDESGLKLIAYEKAEMDKASDAKEKQATIGTIETLGGILDVIPNISGNVQPFGTGASASFGGSNLGSAARAGARAMQIEAGDLNFASSNSGRKSNYLRQLQDRVQQANIAGYEIKNIDKQILSQEIRINIANQEITNQQKQIDNAKEIEEFLRNKYTNKELYMWMEGEIKTLYYQTYTLAYELAKKAEKVFQFERGLNTSNFIKFGYWESAYDGLLSGERLYNGLKQLEAAYQEKRAYDYEVTKQISLRQVNPMALLELRETGTCEFALPEVLFDMDFPGHYKRRIKSVALTVPCVIGPYTNLNCTLRLLEHKYRMNAIAKDKNDYLEKTDTTDERFSTVNVPITSIAASNSQNDSGLFEVNFQGERYLPFEGAGAISKWRLQLPEKFRQFDYDTITDVVLQLRYTALDGGDKLKKPASDSVMEYIKSVEDLSKDEGLFTAIDLKHDFASEWYKAMQPLSDATERVIMLNNLNERLPIFAKGRAPENILANDVFLFTSSDLSAADVVLTQNSNELTFSDGPPVGTLKSFVVKEISTPITNWQIKITDISSEIDMMWLLVRYTLR